MLTVAKCRLMAILRLAFGPALTGHSFSLGFTVPLPLSGLADEPIE
jgi:hypothetical protein